MTSAPHRLILPLDRGVPSLRALAPALLLKARLGAELEVVTWSSSAVEGERARARLVDALAEVGCPMPVEAIVTADAGPGPALAHAAADRDAVLVMASHGRSGLGHAVLHSTAEDVLGATDRPVVLVGPYVGRWSPDGTLLVAVDSSATAEAILEPAQAWAAALRMPVQLVEVVEAGVTCPPDLLEGSYVVRLSRHLADAPSDFDVLHGEPAAAISRHAGRADLIALATRHRTGLARTVLGSVAMRIVHNAPCPVIVGRAGHDDTRTP